MNLLKEEYDKLVAEYKKNKTDNLKEDLKNKLIELDYNLNKEYENNITNNYPMTTTLDKEESRLEKLINYIEDSKEKQDNLVNEYIKLTGDNIELSYLKNIDNLKDYNERLSNVRKILSVIDSINDALKNDKNEIKIKALKNKLYKKELLNLLYEFCIIDSLDTKEIEIDKLFSKDEKINEVLPKKVDEVKNNNHVEEKKFKNNNELIFEPKEEISSNIPKIDKIGVVVPVNKFVSLEDTSKKIPDVVLPSNGIKDDSKNIFIDTQNIF